MNFQHDLAQGLVDDILEAIHKYDDTMMVPTVIGCLEIVKAQVIEDALAGLTPQDDEDEND